jgi:hypothetical protein
MVESVVTCRHRTCALKTTFLLGHNLNAKITFLVRQREYVIVTVYMPLQVNFDATNVLDSHALLTYQGDHMLFFLVKSFIIFTLVGREVWAKEKVKPASSRHRGHIIIFFS